METEKIYAMPFAKIYPLLVNKAVKKGRSTDEVNRVISWLTGYSAEAIAGAAASAITYGDFFRQAPAMHPNRALIQGTVCGVRVETIEEPLLRDIRALDKLIDELAKGRPMEKSCAPRQTRRPRRRIPGAHTPFKPSLKRRREAGLMCAFLMTSAGNAAEAAPERTSPLTARPTGAASSIWA